MYMSYCRFEGTHAELRACLDAASEHINGEAEYPVSEREAQHFCRMVKEFADWLYDMQLLDENGEIDGRVLDDVCQQMTHPE